MRESRRGDGRLPERLLGLPASPRDARVRRRAPDSPVSIPYGERGPSVVLAASTDFELLASHTEAVTRLCPGLLTATTRAETLELMRRAGFHLLYFYCHGGVQDRVPFLKVGGPGERGITGDLLFSERIRWSSPRPLVFINGCRTTALEPETAIQLVSSRPAGAGVGRDRHRDHRFRAARAGLRRGLSAAVS